MLTRIGDVEIWRILEGVTPFATVDQFFPDLAPELLAAERRSLEPHGLRHHPETGKDWLLLPIQAFLLRTPRSLILVDACVGNDKTLPKMPFWNAMRSNRFLAALTAAGAAPCDVTHVLCTHLHVDHVGWTTRRQDGRWVPTFPNARVLATQADLDHACAAFERWPDGTAGMIWRESIAPLLEAGCFDVVAPNHRVEPAVRLRPSPGHTPGHVSVEIAAPRGAVSESVAGGGAITGDLMHSPLQVLAPDLSPSVDVDGALSAQSRRVFLEEAADSRRLVLGTHFPLPSAGHVVRSGEGFRWRPLLG